MSHLPASVTITDDTMREGLQIESAAIPVDAKLRLLDALGETGAKVISIGSFAHPKWTPQMACIEEIAERFVPRPGIRYTAAVFNKAGFVRADRYFPKIDVRKRNRSTFGARRCKSFWRVPHVPRPEPAVAGLQDEHVPHPQPAKTHLNHAPRLWFHT